MLFVVPRHSHREDSRFLIKFQSSALVSSTQGFLQPDGRARCVKGLAPSGLFLLAPEEGRNNGDETRSSTPALF